MLPRIPSEIGPRFNILSMAVKMLKIRLTNSNEIKVSLKLRTCSLYVYVQNAWSCLLNKQI